MSSSPSPDYTCPASSHSDQMSSRLIWIGMTSDPSITTIGMRLHKCATNDSGWYCKNALCPRCQRRIGIARRRQYERELRSVPFEVPVAHATFTTGADDILDGRQALLDALTALRRRDIWTDVVLGGHAQIEVLPAIGGSRRWNVHAHAIVYCRQSRVDLASLRSAWVELLDPLPGSITWTPVARRFVNAQEGARGRRFLACCLLRLQTKTRRVARLHRCAIARDRAGGARTPVGSELRESAERTR